MRLAPVEMSAYIDIVKYKQHEGKHAYYDEMHDKMLELMASHRSVVDGRLSVLELGSGTGNFAVKLARAGHLDLTTIDLDWACYTVLVETLEELKGKQPSDVSGGLTRSRRYMKGFRTGSRHFNIPSLDVQIHCHCEDARYFDPGGPQGRYHCIMSSFADHHIAHSDKAIYFRNVVANLEPGGIFIVGDEFLPPHDTNSLHERHDALHRYHEHIIERTRGNHGDAAEGLVQLEQDALESGLKELGDFKLTCGEYEKHLERAGFEFSRVRIGPESESLADEVGGVYVYRLTVSARDEAGLASR